MDIKDIEKGLRREATTVLTQVILFLLYYFVLILLSIGLLVAAGWITVLMIDLFGSGSRVHVSRGMFVILMLWLAMWWFCIQMTWYLIKPLFKIQKDSTEGYMEVTQKDCPDLFDVIRDIAQKTGNKMPKHVYLSEEMNASVCYVSNSILSLFLPTRKNLFIGAAYAFGYSQEELKSVLAHEFGHFSQTSMKAGVLTFRLMNITESMVKYARSQKEKAEKSKAENNSWMNRIFHIASGPMSQVTRLTSYLYNRIQLKDSSLSRYMEFEADAVACRLVGRTAFISQMYKDDVLSDRYYTYQHVMYNVLGDKQYASDYFAGFVALDKKYADDENLPISYDRPLLSPSTDSARHPKRYTLIESLHSHPTMAERIENAKQFDDPQPLPEPKDARLWFSDELLKKIGTFYQRFAVNYKWEDMKALTTAEIEEYLTEWFNDHNVPHAIAPFTNMSLKFFDRPSAEELATPIPSPLTDENRDLLLNYQSLVSQVFELEDMAKSGVKRVKFDGQVCDIKQAIQTLEDTIAANTEKRTTLTRNIYIYLSQKSQKADELWDRVSMTSYADDHHFELKEIHDMTVAIRNAAEECDNRGETYYLDNETETRLFGLLQSFVENLDYDQLNHWCGSWKDDNETFAEATARWRSFVEKGKTENIVANDLINLCEELYSTFKDISDYGLSYWTELLKEYYKKD